MEVHGAVDRQGIGAGLADEVREELVDAVAGQVGLDGDRCSSCHLRIPAVHRGLVGEATNHESHGVIGRPRPHLAVGICLGEHRDGGREPRAIGGQQVGIGNTLRPHVALPVGQLLADHRAPELVHRGEVPHQVGHGPPGA